MSIDHPLSTDDLIFRADDACAVTNGLVRELRHSIERATAASAYCQRSAIPIDWSAMNAWRSKQRPSAAD